MTWFIIYWSMVKGIAISIYGGAIGASSLQAYVEDVVSGRIPCTIKSHSVKANGLVNNHLFNRTPTVKSKNTVYLTPSLDVSTLAKEMLAPFWLLNAWSSLLPRFPSLPPSEVSKLVASVDMDVDLKCNLKTPSKRQRTIVDSGVYLNNMSFVVDNIRVFQNLDELIPILYYRVNSLNMVAEKLRQDFTVSSSSLSDDVTNMHLNIISLRNNLSSDPGLTNFTLHPVWEGISFTKDSLTELSITILPLVQKITVPLSPSHVNDLIVKALISAEIFSWLQYIARSQC